MFGVSSSSLRWTGLPAAVRSGRCPSRDEGGALLWLLLLKCLCSLFEISCEHVKIYIGIYRNMCKYRKEDIYRHVCMYVCMCAYVHIYIYNVYLYMYTCTCVHVYAPIYIYVIIQRFCIHTYMCAYVCVQICVYTYIHTYTHMYMYTCTYVYACMCIYTYIYMCIQVYVCTHRAYNISIKAHDSFCLGTLC